MYRLLLPFGLIALFSAASLSAQTQPICSANTATPVVAHVEGLAERLGDFGITCTGGTAGANVSLNLFAKLNTAITNRVDADGNLLGITVTGASVDSLALSSGNIASILKYTVPTPSSTPVVITISGVRGAVAPLATGTAAVNLTYTIIGVVGAVFPGANVAAAVSAQTLATSFISNGIPCSGSPLPTTLDFASFAAGSASSTLRLTEFTPQAFTPKDAGSDSGLRFLIKIAGYGTGSRVFVPDVIAGSNATTPTSSGAFGTTISGGSYTAASNQLLLVRVAGADANGAGGSLAVAAPTTGAFNAVSEITLTNGSGYAVYEVVDSNPNNRESAQVPVFVSAASVSCPSTLIPTLSAQLAPVSSVATATQKDPLPRFVPVSPGSDCSLVGDCSAPYYPALTVDTTPLTFTANSKGTIQNSFIRVGNSGSGLVNFTATVAYPAGTPNGWLTVSPTTGANSVSVNVTADPTNLDAGTYTANVNINAGAYGSATVPVTFNVGPVGVTIQAVGNAASFTYGTVTAGSYAVIYGLNLTGANLSVTFSGLNAQVLYNSATQLNVVVPDALFGQQAALVVISADGKVSNPFRVNLAPNSVGIFNPGIINVEDGQINSAAKPASRGKFISLYMTGLSLPVIPGQLTVTLGAQAGIVPDYVGAQPTLPALDQVNVLLPPGFPLTPNPVKASVCILNSIAGQTCSNQVDLYLK